MNIEENNILLSHFLGYSYDIVRYTRFTNSKLLNDEFLEEDEIETTLWFKNGEIIQYEPEFHWNWNQLMLVVEKIRSYPIYNDMNDGSISVERFEINRNSVFMSFAKRINGRTKIGSSYHSIEPEDYIVGESLINMVYNCCVDFVKFINE